jgi:cellulose synthase/poly-beta-1,6-N-acetylglucosamine synthase-like glycosyltransferase
MSLTLSPFISILVAVRNEEATILRCLQALDKLEYPTKRLEVLIGDDASEDNTALLIKEFMADKPHFHYFLIDRNLGKARGKANVLAQLAHQSEGDYLFFTDADVQVSPEWLESISFFTDKQVGVLNGCTLVEGKHLFEQMQCLDWALMQELIYILAQFRVPLTAMGNNMAVSREAYEAAGGYENLSFSLTEDFALFQAIVTKGFDFKNDSSEERVAYTLGVQKISEWLQQRKRWMQGAVRLPWYLVSLLFIQALFLPILLVMSYFNVRLALGIGVLSVVTQGVVLARVLSRAGRIDLLKYFLFYQIFSWIMGVCVVFYYLLPVKIKWKGRTYS